MTTKLSEEEVNNERYKDPIDVAIARFGGNKPDSTGKLLYAVSNYRW